MQFRSVQSCPSRLVITLAIFAAIGAPAPVGASCLAPQDPAVSQQSTPVSDTSRLAKDLREEIDRARADAHSRLNALEQKLERVLGISGAKQELKETQPAVPQSSVVPQRQKPKAGESDVLEEIKRLRSDLSKITARPAKDIEDITKRFEALLGVHEKKAAGGGDAARKSQKLSPVAPPGGKPDEGTGGSSEGLVAQLKDDLKNLGEETRGHLESMEERMTGFLAKAVGGDGLENAEPSSEAAELFWWLVGVGVILLALIGVSLYLILANRNRGKQILELQGVLSKVQAELSSGAGAYEFGEPDPVLWETGTKGSVSSWP